MEELVDVREEYHFLVDGARSGQVMSHQQPLKLNHVYCCYSFTGLKHTVTTITMTRLVFGDNYQTD